MRKLIVTEFITLDGVIEAPGGNETNHSHKGWMSNYNTPETGKYKIDELASVSTLLLGRVTYDMFATFWPTQTDEVWGKPMNAIPKYIVSNSLKKTDWNNSQILSNVPDDIARLKNSEGGNILVYGSATLAKSLLEHKLVDEMHLMMFPISIGGGLRLFDDSRNLNKFTLKQSRSLANGVLILEYQPV